MIPEIWYLWNHVIYWSQYIIQIDISYLCWKLACWNLLAWMPKPWCPLLRSSGYQLWTGLHKVVCLVLLTLISGNGLFMYQLIHLSGISVFSLVTLGKSILIFWFQLQYWFHCIEIKVRLLLTLAFLYVLAFSLLASCLQFLVWLAFGTVTFHVCHFAISWRLP